MTDQGAPWPFSRENLKPSKTVKFGNAMVIRPAKSEELPLLLTIVRQAVRSMEDQGIRQWDEIYPNEKILTGDLREKSVHVVEISEGVCGFIVLNEIQSPEYQNVQWRYSGRVLVVHRLTIAPRFQRRGMASLLVKFAEKNAFEEGYEAIRLDAFTKNPAACRLYAKNGYRPAGIIQLRKGEFYCFEKALSGTRA
jgi:ribosomal protein S18 acetylase RimI-like enzyme